MKLKILYRKIATKFIKKNLSKISKQDIDELIIKAIKKIINKEDINIDLKKMISNDDFFQNKKRRYKDNFFIF
jgi:20S proteasome alpha/beta subunit